MRKAFVYIVLALFPFMASASGNDSLAVVSDSASFLSGRMVPMSGVFLQPLQERDSVLIADQLLYGVELRQVEEGTRFAFPEWKNDEKGGVQAITPWIVDTVKVKKQKGELPKLFDIKAGVVITSFDEGDYQLPPIMIGRLSKDGVLDTLVYDPVRLEVKTMPVDTATFQPHDIKGQIRYPVTAAEVLPWVVGGWLIVMLGILAVCLIIMHRKKNDPENVRKDPPHIVALRKLDKYRGSRMWVPEKQKDFYSGVTDALREYISARYDIGAMEMTSSEIFAEMKSTDVPNELQDELKDLFERSDFVKFAKYVASEDDNAAALPLAVRFVTSTYQTDVENNVESEAQDTENKGGE